MKVSISSYSIRNEWKDLAEDKIDSLIAICNDMGIDGVELLATEWTPETLPAIVNKMKDKGIDVFGIAVFDNVLMKPNEVEEAVKHVEKHNDQIVILQCTSTYPCKFEEINLNVIKTYTEKFDYPIGYSGHELGIAIPVAAAALGACIVERHFTLDRTMKGGDHAASL